MRLPPYVAIGCWGNEGLVQFFIHNSNYWPPINGSSVMQHLKTKCEKMLFHFFFSFHTRTRLTVCAEPKILFPRAGPPCRVITGYCKVDTMSERRALLRSAGVVMAVVD